MQTGFNKQFTKLVVIQYTLSPWIPFNTCQSVTLVINVLIPVISTWIKIASLLITKILIRSYSMVVCIKLEARMSLYHSSGIYFFKIYLILLFQHLPKKGQLHLYESKSLVPMDHLCQVCVHLVEQFYCRRFKCENLTRGSQEPVSLTWL